MSMGLLGVLEERDDHCDQHGAYTALLVKIGPQARWTGCPACAAAEVEAQAAVPSLSPTAMRRALMSAAGVPTRYRDATVSAYTVAYGQRQAKALGWVRDYAENLTARLAGGEGLVMMGTRGTGKTHLACAVLGKALYRDGASGLYITADELLMRMRESYNGQGETPHELMSAMLAPDLLVLDEIGTGKGSDHDINVLASVLTRRHDACRSTIVATNLGPRDLSDWLGDRVVDRLRETARVLSFDWPSHRGGHDE